MSDGPPAEFAFMPAFMSAFMSAFVFTSAFEEWRSERGGDAGTLSGMTCRPNSPGRVESPRCRLRNAG